MRHIRPECEEFPAWKIITIGTGAQTHLLPACNKSAKLLAVGRLSFGSATVAQGFFERLIQDEGVVQDFVVVIFQYCLVNTKGAAIRLFKLQCF